MSNGNGRDGYAFYMSQKVCRDDWENRGHLGDRGMVRLPLEHSRIEMGNEQELTL